MPTRPTRAMKSAPKILVVCSSIYHMNTRYSATESTPSAAPTRGKRKKGRRGFGGKAKRGRKSAGMTRADATPDTPGDADMSAMSVDELCSSYGLVDVDPEFSDEDYRSISSVKVPLASPYTFYSHSHSSAIHSTCQASIGACKHQSNGSAPQRAHRR